MMCFQDHWYLVAPRHAVVLCAAAGGRGAFTAHAEGARGCPRHAGAAVAGSAAVDDAGCGMMLDAG